MSRPRTHAFARADLIVTVAVVVCLAGWLVFTHTGERGRIAACAHNLRNLSQAMHSDAHDHHNELVPAEIDVGAVKASWDGEIMPYLKPPSPSRFHCPSDTFERGPNPRTYALAARDMTMGWPPTKDDRTGIGLLWNHRTIVTALGEDAWEPAQAHPETLPRLNLSVVSAPARTLLLSELLMPDNVLGHAGSTRIFNARQQIYINKQVAKYGGGPAQFHNGKFNYLMADGHVECLTGLEGGVTEKPDGIWTINPGD